MHFKEHEVIPIDHTLYEIPATGKMHVPARIYASEQMMQQLLKEGEPVQQVINVAQLPGIQKYSLAMPDIHWGYGFPIGGVAATHWENGVISPGGVGYDINCGVRMVATGLRVNDVQKRMKSLTEQLYKSIPSGVGSSHAIRKLSKNELKSVLSNGVNWALEQGFGESNDYNFIEEKGRMKMADAGQVSDRALERGQDQIGTLGSGNHFLELQKIDQIYDQQAADILGIHEDQLVIMMHTGSRGFGYQVCDDYLRVMNKASEKYQIRLPDRQLASAPINSGEGSAYFEAMSCAANYAWCNRQVIMHLANRVMKQFFGIGQRELGFRLIYDVSHNIAKKESHTIGGKTKDLCVHRKGATRALGPSHPLLPEKYKAIGQPVIIPGDMGRYSFLCLGSHKAEGETFGSTCHGAGRLHSRNKAKRLARGRNLFKEMSERGVVVQARGKHTMAEEMPEAYKDVAEVVNIMHQSGISRKVARLKPVAVIKG